MRSNEKTIYKQTDIYLNSSPSLKATIADRYRKRSHSRDAGGLTLFNATTLLEDRYSSTDRASSVC